MIFSIFRHRQLDLKIYYYELLNNYCVFYDLITNRGISFYYSQDFRQIFTVTETSAKFQLFNSLVFIAEHNIIIPFQQFGYVFQIHHIK